MFSKVLVLCLASTVFAHRKLSGNKFPDSFQFGVATAAYQIEGSWNMSGKGENIWDRLCHQTKLVRNEDTGDVACDSYNQYKRDVEMLSDLGVDFYRFSISWARLLPEGFIHKVNQDGIDYYNNLIDALLAANIKPVVTLYHWDLPQKLQDIGGWTNGDMVQHFADYANLAFSKYADRVDIWLTFNEPMVFCQQGYGDQKKAPALNVSGIAEYLCMHTILKAHAKVYHLYDEKYRPIYKGRIGLTVNSGWNEPESNSDEDVEAAERVMQYETGWVMNAIFSKQGNYPSEMIETIGNRSKSQGFSRSRLPEFTPQEIEYIKGTSDMFGINHYTTRLVRSVKPEENIEGIVIPSFWDDMGVTIYQPDDWPSTIASWFKIAPWGFTKLLRWIKDTYDNPEIMVFECGYVDENGVEDYDRINYYHDYLNAMMEAMKEGANVTAFTAWSLMDNFEWMKGYSERFGLYHVDFEDPKRTRIPKLSVTYLRDVIKHRYVLDAGYLNNGSL